MTRAARLGWLIALLLLLASASAGAEPQVQVGISAEEVEVDEPVTVTMKVLFESRVAPAQPQLKVPEGFSVTRPSTFLSSFNLRINGRQSLRQSFTANWVIAPNRKGTFTIPPPSVIVDGETVTASKGLRLKVVAKGSLPGSRSRRQGFGGMGSFFFGPRSRSFDISSLLDEDDRPLSLEGRELRMRRAPDPAVFIRIVPSKTKAYVGEQITLAYYVYSRVRRGRGDYRNPALNDFIRHDLPNPSRERELVLTQVGARRFYANLTGQEAVFPLRTGNLHTGVLKGTFTIPKLGRRPVERESNDAVIEVVEPPVDGRPAGYRIGDVGRNLRLSAEVAPREITAGGTVSVQARLEGIGLLPTKLKLPERAGVEWYQPELKGELQRTRGQLGGWRTFGYAVRLDQPGAVDLGEVTLPYWDPKAKRYVVVRAKLGSVRVRPGKTPAPSASGSATSSDDVSPFAKLGPPRSQLTAYTPEEASGFSPSLLWTLVLVPPLGVAFVGGVWRGADGLRRRRRERADAPGVLARAALTEAARADDAKETAARCEKALHLAIEAGTGLKSRGVLLDELTGRLAAEGVKEATAEETVATLRRCGELRFAPADEADAALLEATRKLVKALTP